MANSFNASEFSLLSTSEVTHDEFPSRSVVVKNLSPITRKEDIIIHFQRKRNGGGEVECVRLLSERAAVVTFEKLEVAESVLKRWHEIDGFQVKLEPHCQSSFPEVFGKVSGRIDHNTFGLSCSSMKTILQNIQEEIAVEWKEIFDGLVVSGTFEEIKRVNEVFATTLKENKSQKKGLPVRDARAINYSSSESHNKPINKRSTSVLEKSQDKMNQRHKKPKSNTRETYANIPVHVVNDAEETRVVDDSIPESKSTETNKIKLPASAPENIQVVRYQGVETNISQKGSDLNDSILVTVAQPDFVCDDLHLSSQEKFPDFGNGDTNNACQDLIETKQHCNDESLLKSLDHNQMKSDSPDSQVFDQFPTKLQSSGHDIKGTPKSENKSCSTLAASNQDCTQGQMERSVTSECGNESKAVLYEGKERSAVGGNHRQFVTSTGITVSLLKGDITHQNVDVLLCPANSTLSYGGGLSRLIIKKGGLAIQNECLTMTQCSGPLKGGDTVMTSGGSLPCRAVLHAVLPLWDDELHDQKECKRMIHRCLKEGLILSSGYRHKSIAIAPLGQDWNAIPVQVSAEVIIRVIAAFSRTIGPMHCGINDICIVCEDEATIEVFLKELSLFSCEGKPFFASVSSKKELLNSGTTDASFRSPGMMRSVETSGLHMLKEKSVEQFQKVFSQPEPVSPIGGIHANEPTAVEIRSSLQLHKSTEEKVENDKISIDCPAVSIEPYCEFDRNAHRSYVDQDCSDGQNNASNEKEATEEIIPFVSFSSVERIEVSVIKAFEILQVSAAVQIEEETTKSSVVPERSQEASNLNEGLVLGDTLYQGEKGARTYKAAKETSGQAQEIQQPEFGDSTFREERNEDSRDAEIHDQQGGPKCKKGHSPTPRGQHTLNFSSFVKNCGSLLTSPTVDSLLNADLGLSDQGLELLHDRDSGESSRRSVNLEGRHDKNRENKSFVNFQGVQLSSNEFPGTAEPKTMGEPIQRNHLDETTEKEDGLGFSEIYQPECKAKESERQLSILCALCQDTVDHPDLTHPNMCMKHKFCDDCILRAFTISSNCPACVDTAGLITIDKEDVNKNSYINAPASTSSCPQNLDMDDRWKATSDAIKANQPPGQMMWKKYKASLPGFEGYGTIAVTFYFYGGIQSSEHPNPGGVYKGTSCVAYLPETQEGTEILKLLQKAFDARLAFTVSTSTSDGTGCVALNGIELKTSSENDSRDGYPDPAYLSRVRKQLIAKGIC